MNRHCGGRHTVWLLAVLVITSAGCSNFPLTKLNEYTDPARDDVTSFPDRTSTNRLALDEAAAVHDSSLITQLD